MRNIWISAAAAAAVIVTAGGQAGAQDRQPGQNQAPAAEKMQGDRDPPPGVSNMDRKGERAQTSAGQGQEETQASETKPTSN